MTGPSCLGDTGPCRVRNLEVSALYEHRLPWHNCGSWAVVAGGWGHPPLQKGVVGNGGRIRSASTKRLSILRVGAGVLTGPRSRTRSVPAVGAATSRPHDHHRTKQEGRHQAVWVRTACLPILAEPGPRGPEREAQSTQLLPAENNWRTEVARPRKQGSRGGDLERPLRVAFLGATLPGAFLVPFWASKKEHPSPPPRRAKPNQQKR